MTHTTETTPNAEQVAARLTELAERCEAATGPDRELDALIAVALGAWPNTLEAEPSVTDDGEWSIIEREPDGRKIDRFSPESVTASLDAATALVPEGADYAIERVANEHWCSVDGPNGKRLPCAGAATPALALCAAALRASEILRREA